MKDSSGRPYRCYAASAERKGYSGTAILTRIEPLGVRLSGEAAFDSEGRLIIADFPGLSVASAYFPNSQDGGARLAYKLDFCAAVMEFCRSSVASGGHVLVSGDYNIAHKPIDLANPEANEDNPGYLPEERAWMDSFTGAGFVDSFRRFCGDPGKYTWWTYRVPGARERNVGWRLDYHCVDPELSPRLISSDMHPAVLGSDHCPVSVDIDLEGLK
jgi:exodeoxyribonuclease-3